MKRRDDLLDQSIRNLKRAVGLTSKRDSRNSRGHYLKENDMGRYDNHTKLDQGEIVVAFGVAECLAAVIGALTVMIGVGIDSLILLVFGASCLVIFILALIVAGSIAIGMYRRSVAEPEDPEVTK